MASAAATLGGLPTVNIELLRGFGFTCRDDCGLCCYAEPRLRAREKPALLRIAPATQIVAHDAAEFLSARPDGGACQFLRDRRCRVHTARPAPCREFPVTVHLGTRLQASLVLSCPGLELGPLRGWRDGPTGPVHGLATEVAAVRERVEPSTARRIDEATRRRARLARQLADEGRWREEEEVRARVGAEVPFPADADFPVEAPPSADDGLESLPLFYDARPGPVALADGLGGWHLLELRESGGVERTIAVVPPPESPPELTREGKGVLEGYLRYWLARDALFGFVHIAMLESDEGDVEEWVRSELAAIGALVLARADVRLRARAGEPRPLGAFEVQEGIRACDQDLLDRAGWGDRL